jgi:serine/threonine protein kinase
MSPEYASEGIYSVKSDVFSFGVLLLEILSAKRNSGFHRYGEFLNLLGYVSICFLHEMDASNYATIVVQIMKT